jgi:hypothetical protein
MNAKLQIEGAGSVVFPAYLALLKRGYAVRCEKPLDGEDGEIWIAESNTTRLTADDVVVLLGLAALVEARGENWRASDAEVQAFLVSSGFEAEDQEEGNAEGLDRSNTLSRTRTTNL